MKTARRCTWLLGLTVIVAALVLAPSVYGQTGSGALTVTNGATTCGNNGFVGPNHWDVNQNQSIHINISAAFNICTAGPNQNNTCSGDSACNVTGTYSGPLGGKTCKNSPVNNGGSCTTAADCTYFAPAVTCSQSLECTGSTNVFVKGKTADTCSSDADCVGIGNVQECDLGEGLCKFVDTISATSTGTSIDVDYTTRSNDCSTAVVSYCSISLQSNASVPSTGNFIPADLRSVSTDGTCTSLNDSQACSKIPDCRNIPGSLCCGLTMGAYGSPNSVATALGGVTYGNCSSNDQGYVPAGACNGCNVFAPAPTLGANGTTIGVQPVRSVTIEDLSTLITYLPASGTAKRFDTTGAVAVNGDVYYGTSATPIPAANLSGAGTKGNGAGTLAGQAMGCAINSFLSNCSLPFYQGGTFTASGFGGFTLPSDGSLVCTRRSGSDLVLGTSDDICQAFSYPSCVAGKR